MIGEAFERLSGNRVRQAVANAFPDLPPLDAPTVAILKSAMGNSGEQRDWAIAAAEFKRIFPKLETDIGELKRLHERISTKEGKKDFDAAAGAFRNKLYALILEERGIRKKPE